MTPTRFKYMQLAEQERANRAQEELAKTRNKVEVAKTIVNGITNVLGAALPFGLDIAKWKAATPDQIGIAIQALEKHRNDIGRLNDDQYNLLKGLISLRQGGRK